MVADKVINSTTPALSKAADPDATFTFTADDDGETLLSKTAIETAASGNQPEISYHYQKTQGFSLRYTEHIIDESEAKNDADFQYRVNKNKASLLRSWMPAIVTVVAVSCVILLTFLFLNSQKDRKTYRTSEVIEEAGKE